LTGLASLAALGAGATTACAFDILAIGSSATNCKGVDRDKTYPVRLEAKLRADGYGATVINGGVDGDRPVWMLKRLQEALTPATNVVIYEPGPNDPDKAYALQYTEKALAFLQQKDVATIYVSNRNIQSDGDAAATAKKYGAFYYGAYSKNVPVDRAHWQFDNEKAFGGSGRGPGGHMTAAGCQLVADGVAPLVEQVLAERFPGRKN
jgi:lysophospholipase L1-like esterase